MPEFHEVRGSVILANEAFKLKTPDADKSWLLHSYRRYSTKSFLLPLSVAEITEDVPRSELLIARVGQLSRTLSPRERIIIQQMVGFDRFREIPETFTSLANKHGVGEDVIERFFRKAVRKLIKPQSQNMFIDFINRESAEVIAEKLNH